MCGTPVAQVESLLFAIPCHGDVGFDVSSDQVGGPGITELREDVTTWLRNFVRWLAIATSQSIDARNPDPKFFHRRSTNIVHVVADGERVSFPSSGSPTLIVYVDRDGPSSERVINSRVLMFAAHRAGTEIVPGASEMLAWARIACRRGEMRRAIIDAGTVVEHALTRLLSLPTDHRKTLGELVDLATHQVPSDIKRHLVKPRNDAVHRGLSPASVMVERALAIAEELLARVEPDLIRADSLRAVDRPQRQDLLMIKPPPSR